MSVRSPALAVYTAASNNFTVYYFAQTRADYWLHGITLVVRTSGAKVHFMDLTSHSKHADTDLADQTMHTRVSSLVAVLESHAGRDDPIRRDREHGPADVSTRELGREHVLGTYICIEGYAYSRFGHSSSVSKICEATGIFKFLLGRAGMSYSVLPPSAAKRAFTGKGGANKRVMLDSFLGLLSYPSVLHSHLKMRKLSARSPLYDIVDAMSIVLYCVFGSSGTLLCNQHVPNTVRSSSPTDNDYNSRHTDHLDAYSITHVSSTRSASEGDEGGGGANDAN